MKLFKTFNASSEKMLLGFELDEERMKIVLVRVGGRRREVSSLAVHDARGSDDAGLAALVSKTVAEFKLSVPPLAFIAAPLASTITRRMELPSRDAHEVREMLSLQATRHTPYSRSEIILDTLILNTKENYTSALMVIVPREPVLRQAKILEKAGLKVERVFFPAEGVGAACSKIAPGKTLAIVHMDAIFTSFMVADGGKVFFLRGIPLGAEQLADASSETRTRFEEEAHKSFEAYSTEEHCPKPSLLLLTGITGEMMDFDPLFRGLGIPLQHQIDTQYFPITAEAKKTAAASKNISFFNVIAPLLLFDKMRVDLVPDEQRVRRQLEERGRELVKTGIFALVLVFLMITSFTEKMLFKKAYLEHLTLQYKPLVENAHELETMFSKNQAVKSHLANRGRSLGSLVTLYEAIPVEVSVTDIRYEEGEKFSVKGSAPSMGAVFSLVSSLEKSANFKDVKTKHVTSRSEQGDVVDFEVSATMKDAPSEEA